MEIIDKTNDTWEIGDTVTDNDGRVGMIKKDKDDDFVIIRIDDAHVGTYCNGLAYEFGCSMQRLQHNAPKFLKSTIMTTMKNGNLVILLKIIKAMQD